MTENTEIASNNMVEAVDMDKSLAIKVEEENKDKIEVKTTWLINHELKNWNTRAKLFFTSLFMSLIPTVTDMGSDSYLAWTFFHGDHYTKRVANETYPTVELCGDAVF